MRPPMDRAALHRQPQKLQATMLTKDGRRMELNLAAVPVIVDDEVVGMLAVQAADKEYAVQAVRSLRTLLEANRAAHAAAADGA